MEKWEASCLQLGSGGANIQNSVVPMVEPFPKAHWFWSTLPLCGITIYTVGLLLYVFPKQTMKFLYQAEPQVAS